MSVLASKRKESKFEAITFSIDLHDMLLDFIPVRVRSVVVVRIAIAVHIGEISRRNDAI